MKHLIRMHRTLTLAFLVVVLNTARARRGRPASTPLPRRRRRGQSGADDSMVIAGGIGPITPKGRKGNCGPWPR